jgi:hypothetical protein
VKQLNQRGSTVIVIAVAVGVLAIACFVFLRMTTLKKSVTKPQPSILKTEQSETKSDYQALANDEVKLSGTVTGKYDDRPMDGDAGVIIDRKYRVLTDVGGDLSVEQRANLAVGKAETVNIGDKVEVYGKKTGLADKVTLVGNATYYLKKL